MKFLRADDEIDVRHQLKQFRAARLRHAAKKPKTTSGRCFRHATQHSHFAQCLLLRHVTHTAGVEEHDISLEFVRGSFVATIEQQTRDLFRVPLVHLATVGFDEKFRHSRGQRYTNVPASPSWEHPVVREKWRTGSERDMPADASSLRGRSRERCRVR
jgi:endonuclease/exonuclease/phosphatase family metal-dependent hydrolase